MRLYDRLFTVPNPEQNRRGQDLLGLSQPRFAAHPQTGCKVEPSLADARPGAQFQFERKGFFCVDPDSKPGHLVFNQTVPLRDTWAKIEEGRKKG